MVSAFLASDTRSFAFGLPGHTRFSAGSVVGWVDVLRSMYVLASPLVRFIHTSDWHLGRHLHGLSLHDAHQAFIDHLVELARSERVDAVLIAGDLYDRAVPPPDAVGLWDQAQTRLVLEARTQVVVIAGNHDSPARLGVSSRLLERAGVHVRVGTGAVGTPVLVEDEHTAVACYPVPFLEPASAVVDWGLEDRGHAAALRAAMDRVRSDLAGRPGHRSVVMAHAFVFGGQVATPSGTSAWVACSMYPVRSSKASITWRSATCTAVSVWPTGCDTAVRRWLSVFPRPLTSSRPTLWTSTLAGCVVSRRFLPRYRGGWPGSPAALRSC
ncbi:exonuclease subunit SbcD [Micromonospora sp. C31]|nr:exonuclease subunit SbcD [Micromonospora sp. C31]